jgi:uncharacterized protein YndB with AHSA1/START domain
VDFDSTPIKYLNPKKLSVLEVLVLLLTFILLFLLKPFAMTDTTSNYADAAMLIRKPVAEVFNAFVDPEITSRFWFTSGSGKLKVGEKVEWTWSMHDFTIPVNVLSLKENRSIEIQWGEDEDAMVIWDFEVIDSDQTFVTITNTGFKGSIDEIIAQVRDSTGGFTWVLAGLKAFLEYGIELNLVADRYPDRT